MTHWTHHRLVDRYFAGRVDARGDAKLRARLGRCGPCRARYALHLVAEAAVPEGDERAIERLWQGIQRASAKDRAPAMAGPVPTPRALAAPSWSWLAPRRLAVVGALLGVTVLVVNFSRTARVPTDGRAVPEPVARGGGDALRAAPAIHVFRSVSDHSAEPVVGTGIRASDGLLFAYSNPDPALTHLMVFAVDQTYAVHWYYPAYQRLGDNPEAVPVLSGTIGAELGEEIRHPLRSGPVRVFALFLREPHRVLEIESMIRQLVQEPRRSLTEEVRFPIRGLAQQSVLLGVEP